MKLAKKMILVPASGRNEPEIDKMSSLHLEMSTILKNQKYSVSEKIKLYNEVLRKQLAFEARFKQKPLLNEQVAPIEENLINETKITETNNSEETIFDRTEFKNLKTPKFVPREIIRDAKQESDESEYVRELGDINGEFQWENLSKELQRTARIPRKAKKLKKNYSESTLNNDTYYKDMEKKKKKRSKNGKKIYF